MTAFGIVAVLLSVLGVVTPILGVLLSGFSGFLAILISNKLDPLANTALIINLLNVTIFSPRTVGAIFNPTPFFYAIGDRTMVVYIICVLIQLIGILLWRMNYVKRT